MITAILLELFKEIGTNLSLLQRQFLEGFDPQKRKGVDLESFMEELNLNQEQKRKFREAYLNQQQKEKEEEEKRYQYKYEPKSENVTDKFDAYWKKFEDKYGKDFYEKYQQQQQHQNTNYDQKAQQDLSKLQTELKKNAAILGVKETATFEEIKTAYKNLMKKYHPDKFQNDPQKKKEAEEKSSKINVAYEFFKKREQKAAQK